MKVTQGRTCSDIQLSPLAQVLWAKAGSTPKSLWHHMLDPGHCASVVAEDARFQSSIEAIADWMDLTVPQAKRLVAYLAASCGGGRPALSSKALRPVQRTVLQCADPSAGLTVIEAPMGEGKTEAGAFQAARLCSLWKKQGIYFALPTAATSNQMYGRIEEMLSTLGMGSARLMHGMAWFVERQTQLPQNADEDDRAAAYDWLQPLRRAMLEESAVGTVDQAMLAVMPVKYGRLRSLGLTGKVLVIDEIHAYDAYMGGIIERLLEWCRALRIPVILLSATLTAEKRGRLVEAYGGHLDEIDEHYPLITQVSEGQARQIPVDGCTMEGCFHFLPLALWNVVHSIACRAVERVAHGGCLCVLMNTVAQAQKVWQEARKGANAAAIAPNSAHTAGCAPGHRDSVCSARH